MYDESFFVKTKIDMTTYMSVDVDGTVTTDEIVKEIQICKKKPKQECEEEKWSKHHNFGNILWNLILHQLDESVTAGVKLHGQFAAAKTKKNVITLLRILKNVVNKGEYGA